MPLDDYSFAKTVVPVRLAKIGDENLVSRSQAKRLLQRVDRFRCVVLDFDQVGSIGQAFYWVIGAHIVAALWHHLFRRDDTLKRML